MGEDGGIALIGGRGGKHRESSTNTLGTPQLENAGAAEGTEKGGDGVDGCERNVAGDSGNRGRKMSTRLSRAKLNEGCAAANGCLSR